jgi:hypothetical protein
MSTDTQSVGTIAASEAYTTQEFRKRAGIGDYTWRRLRRELPIVTIGRKQYVLGQSWIDYLLSQKGKEG